VPVEVAGELHRLDVALVEDPPVVVVGGLAREDAGDASIGTVPWRIGDSTPWEMEPMVSGSRGSVLVVGGGIGGLTAAIALRRAGFVVRVLERAETLRPVGAGLTVQPNALSALDHVDLGDAVARAGTRLCHGILRSWRGRELSHMRLDEVAPGLSAPVGIHRATLQGLLLDALPEEVVRLGAEVTAVAQEGDEVVATLAGGATLRADLLVGADGIHSMVRRSLHGDQPPRYAGYTCWRGVLARRDGWPHDRVTESWGPGRRVGLVPVDGDRLYWFAVLDAPRGGRDTGGASAAVQEMVGGWFDPVPAIVAATPEADIRRDDIEDRPPLEVWGCGRITLLGDAAHPMTPNMGQGACQAIEDAVVLAHLLGHGDPVAALRSYEARRRPRTRWFVESSWRIGATAQWHSGPLRCLRDAGMQLVPDALAARTVRKSWRFDLPDGLQPAE